MVSQKNAFFIVSSILAVLMSCTSSSYSYGSQSFEEDLGSYYRQDENTSTLSLSYYLRGLLDKLGLYLKPTEIHAVEQPVNYEEHSEENHKQPYEEYDRALEQYEQPEEQHDPLEEHYEKPEKQHEDAEEQYEQSDEQYEQSLEQHEQPEEEHEKPEKQHEDAEEQYEQSDEQYEQSVEQHEQPEEEHEKPEKQHEDAEEQYEQSDEQYEQSVEQHEQPEEEHEKAEKHYEDPIQPYQQPEEEDEEYERYYVQPTEETIQDLQRPEEPQVQKHEENNGEPNDFEAFEFTVKPAGSDLRAVSSVKKTRGTTFTATTKRDARVIRPGKTHEILGGITPSIEKVSGVPPVTPHNLRGGATPTRKKTACTTPATKHKKTVKITPMTKKVPIVTPVTTHRTTERITPRTKKFTTATPLTTQQTTRAISTTEKVTPTTTHGRACRSSTGVTSVTAPKTSVTAKPPSHLCDTCSMPPGVHYAPYPGQCRYFIECRFHSHQRPEYTIEPCDFNQKWNQTKLVCDKTENVKCTSALRCPNKKPIFRNNKAYLSFINNKWVRVYCEPNKVYSDITCNCSEMYESCVDKIAIRGDKTGYMVVLPCGSVRRNCPSGLGFDKRTCECTIRLGKPKNQCKPTLMLLFDTNDPSDSSPNNFWVNNTGVTFKDGKAYFNGNARLTIPEFSNMDLGNTLSIYIKYTPVNPCRPQTLLAYGDCNILPSVHICSDNKLADYYTKTDGQREPKSFSQVLNKRTATTYEIKYLLTNGFIETPGARIAAVGSIERRSGGLVIGAGADCGNFHGFIDEVLVYLCNPKTKASA